MKIFEIIKEIIDFFKRLGEEMDKASAENQKFYLEFYEKHGHYPGHIDPFHCDIWS